MSCKIRKTTFFESHCKIR